MKGDKVYILATGDQSAYGINEIIEIIPMAHINKIKAVMARWYNPPKMRLNSKIGPRLGFDYDGKLFFEEY